MEDSTLLAALGRGRQDHSVNQMGERAVAAFYELRQYKIQPGMMAEWLECMEKEIIPFQVGKGMVITGSFRGETDESVYVWIRRFESEEPVSYTHLTLPRYAVCRSRWSPYH